MAKQAGTAPGAAALLALLLLLFSSAPGAAAPSGAPTLYRIFLHDGSTLVSYGTFARVTDRVVFSLPIGGTKDAPTLQLVSIPESSVDWKRTGDYAEAVRAAEYAATDGPNDYVLLTNEVARVLNEIALTPEPKRRLAMATEARKNLMQWAADHYGYRAPDISQLAGLFDSIVSEARAATGGTRFDLSFVATTSGPPAVPLLAAPTEQERLEEAVRVAALTPEPTERVALLHAVGDELKEVRDEGWAPPLRARVSSEIEIEDRTDRAYASLTKDLARSSRDKAHDADVRGLQQLIARALRTDDRLGHKRPQAYSALLSLLDSRLAAARRLRLERDRWAASGAQLRRYRKAIAEPSGLLRGCRRALEDIRDLAGPSRSALARLADRASLGERLLALTRPPAEAATVQTLLTSAMQMAARAASARQRAIASGNMATAWDAASAASGALMMFERATGELERLSRRPELK
ncbi:MAG TPA: hypothetical protein VFX12_07735 [Vicinamibacterales bacterium]|nr:hypothetical protein [Vicinamibacterales bacterium]